MDRSEAYAEGFHTGRRWAEYDIANGNGYEQPWPEQTASYGEAARAESLGYMRGYRDTVARFEAGTLTRQMFERAPRSVGHSDPRPDPRTHPEYWTE